MFATLGIDSLRSTQASASRSASMHSDTSRGAELIIDIDWGDLPVAPGVMTQDDPVFEPPTSASGAQFPIAFPLRFSGFRDFRECAVARKSVRFCALVGLVIPPSVVQLAWAVLQDKGATEREVKLARWLLLSTLTEIRER